MILADLLQGGISLACGGPKPAAGREAASTRRRQQVRRQALDSLQAADAHFVEARHRAQEPVRVGMARGIEDGVGPPLLDDPPRIHHRDAIGVARDDAEVMSNNHQADAEAPRQILHQFEDLRLDGHVEGRGGFVGNDQSRIAGQRDGDHDTLPHAAGELMRKLSKPPFRIADADQTQQLDRARARLLRRHAEMDAKRLRQLEADAEHRVQAGHRLLEYHGDVAAADLAHAFLGSREQVLAAKYHAALHDPAYRLLQQAHHCKGGDRLPASTLTHQRERLARGHRPGDTVHRTQLTARRREFDRQVLDRKQGRSCRRRAINDKIAIRA